MIHLCHAAGCNRRCPPKMFACRQHWFALPNSARDAVWREYRSGQEVDKRPSLRYLAVQRYAVAFLAGKDGLDRERDAAVFDAVMYEAMCREKGLGEPFAGLFRFWELPA